MAPEPIRYRTGISVGGHPLYCIEEFDSVWERWRSSAFGLEEAGFSAPEPLELTVGLQHEDGEKRFVRAAVNPTTISWIWEIPPEIASEAP